MFSDPFPTSDVSHKRQAGMLEYPRRSSELSSAQQHIEEDAIYFSRRAREERQAFLRGDCRKCRRVHLELAQAYEFRAHLSTHEMRRAVDELLSAL